MAKNQPLRRAKRVLERLRDPDEPPLNLRRLADLLADVIEDLLALEPEQPDRPDRLGGKRGDDARPG